MDPEMAAYIKALEAVKANAALLVQRLAAMEQSGTLSPVAKQDVGPWADRLAAHIQSVPPKPEQGA